MRYLPVLIVTAVLANAAAAETPPGFEPLFNGKDLSGWKATGNIKVWGAEDGVLFVAGGGGGWLLSDKAYADFELRLEYKMPKMGNSGVGIRTPLPSEPRQRKGWDPAYDGMEIQILDDANWKGLQSWQHTGSIYNVVPAQKVNSKPFGQWNSMRIVAKGPHILIEHNGATLVDANLEEYKKAHAARHPGILRDRGHIGFQSYNFRVEFRNIVIKELK